MMIYQKMVSFQVTVSVFDQQNPPAKAATSSLGTPFWRPPLLIGAEVPDIDFHENIHKTD